MFAETDLADDDAVRACVQAAHGRFGRIDMLVDVACAYIDDALASTRAHWLAAFDVNVVGACMLLPGAHRFMREAGGGASRPLALSG